MKVASFTRSNNVCGRSSFREIGNRNASAHSKCLRSFQNRSKDLRTSLLEIGALGYPDPQVVDAFRQGGNRGLEWAIAANGIQRVCSVDQIKAERQISDRTGEWSDMIKTLCKQQRSCAR